jgi:hypothetical protein
MYPHFGQRIFLPHEEKVTPPRCGVTLCHRPVDRLLSHTKSEKIKVREKKPAPGPIRAASHRPVGGKAAAPAGMIASIAPYRL